MSICEIIHYTYIHNHTLPPVNPEEELRCPQVRTNAQTGSQIPQSGRESSFKRRLSTGVAPFFCAAALWNPGTLHPTLEQNPHNPKSKRAEKSSDRGVDSQHAIRNSGLVPAGGFPGSGKMLSILGRHAIDEDCILFHLYCRGSRLRMRSLDHCTSYSWRQHRSMPFPIIRV